MAEPASQDFNLSSIFQIPECMLTYENQSEYKPQVISLGPYHYGEERLKVMDEVKLRVLHHFLETFKKDVAVLIDLLKPNVNVLMDAYQDLEEEWKKDEEKFLQMMILDASIIVAILKMECSRDSTIFTKKEKLTIIPLIKKDMLLLENQLPFHVIDKLSVVFEVDKKNALQQFFFPGGSLTVQFNEKSHHLLHIFLMSFLTVVVEESVVRIDESSCADDLITTSSYSVKSLHDYDIKFTGVKSNIVSNVKLDKYMVHLPNLFIDRNSEMLFMNVVAYEKLGLKDHRMSSFLSLMSGLLLTPEDVKLLRDMDVIHSHAISNDAIIDIIQSATRELVFRGNDEFCHLQRQLNIGYITSKKSWRRKFAQWFSIFYNSHWTTIAGIVGGAVSLFATVFGSYYTYKSYNATDSHLNMMQEFIGNWAIGVKIKPT